MKTVLNIRKEYKERGFLNLTPLDRMRVMYQVISEIIAIRARAEGTTEYEIYRRYLKNRDKKLKKLLSPPEEPFEESSEELI